MKGQQLILGVFGRNGAQFDRSFSGEAAI